MATLINPQTCSGIAVCKDRARCAARRGERSYADLGNVAVAPSLGPARAAALRRSRRLVCVAVAAITT